MSREAIMRDAIGTPLTRPERVPPTRRSRLGPVRQTSVTPALLAANLAWIKEQLLAPQVVRVRERNPLLAVDPTVSWAR
jgi:hypothetical protein